ncbi:MAG: FKBP-type peptidyl-prolyl cis-trans isomerase [Nitrospiraceae bacterium]
MPERYRREVYMKCRYVMSCVFAAATCVAMAVPLRAETSTAPITDGSKVTIEMTISVPEEHVMIPNHKSEYIHGARQLIPGLENALTGMHAGEKKRVELDADHAFGPYVADKKTSVPRSQLPDKVRVGDITTTTDGKPFTVVALSEGTAVIDFNHPLAGKQIVLDVRVLDVKPKA